jgi:hypothetical protein
MLSQWQIGVGAEILVSTLDVSSDAMLFMGLSADLMSASPFSLFTRVQETAGKFCIDRMR